MAKRRRGFRDKQAFIIHCGTFDVDVGVCVNMNAAEIMAWVDKEADGNQSVGAIEEFQEELKGWGKPSDHGQMLILGSAFVVALNTKRDRQDKALGALVHEMVHVTQYLLRRRRVPLSEDTEEVHAYLTDFLVRTAWRKLHGGR